jgi:glycosyltransferase involved in cell wall biosynthesis
MNTTVDIGIPAYNNAAFIAETIKGCLDQQYSAIKVIVADDRSPDNTLAIAQSFSSDARVIVSQNKNNLGRVQNYQHLLYDLASSNWYINLDGDDYFTDPAFISHAMELIEKNGNDAIAFYQGNHDIGKLKTIFTNYTVLSDEEILVEGKDYFRLFPRIQRNTHCATLYNRAKALPIGFYSFDCLFSDFHSLSRLALTGKIILSGKNVAVWREHGGNASKTLDEKKLPNELAAVDEVAVFAKQYIGEKEANDWLKQMKDYFKMVFIYHNSTHRPGIKTIRFILGNWQWSGLYFRYIVKNIVLMMRNLIVRPS